MYSYSTRTSKAKGDTVEYIAKEILYELGAETIVNIVDSKEQLNIGDYLIINKKGKRKTVEVKTSHQYKKIDKLAMDYKYFKYYNRTKQRLEPYFQKNTFHEFGWLVDNRADLLLAFNPKRCKAYVIKDFKTVAENILKDIENYINSLELGEVTWYNKKYNNYINKYLEGSIKIDGELKQSLIVNLLLNKEAIKYYGGLLKTLQIELYVNDMPIKEYENSIDRFNRQREERNDIIKLGNKSEKNKKPLTTGTCKKPIRFNTDLKNKVE